MIAPSTLTPGNLYLLSGPPGFTGRRMHALIVRASLAGPLRVLVGGNRFSIYEVAYALASETGHYREILEENISLSRAETGHQMAELLKETPGAPTLTLVSDLLTPFYEESLSEREVDQLLFESTLELRRLKEAAPVVVGAHPESHRPRLLRALEGVADQVEYPKLKTKTAIPQRRFFQ